MIKYCVKCGKQFDAVGREVICPACKAHAAEDAKRAAVLKAKRASWSGESVPVRISGRASTVIREFGKAHNLPFAQALDELLKTSDFLKSTGKAWEEVEPYKSHRRDKSAAQDVPQEDKTVQAIDKLLKASVKAWDAEDKQAAGKPQDMPQEVKTAAKQAAKQEVKTAAKASASKASASKASASKAAGKAAGKATSKE